MKKKNAPFLIQVLLIFRYTVTKVLVAAVTHLVLFLTLLGKLDGHWLWGIFDIIFEFYM